MNWINNISNLEDCLKSLSARDKSGNETDSDSAFAQWKEQTVRVRENRKTVYLVGNGASASMASHFSADLAKNGRVHTEVFTDLSLITAIANDISYKENGRVHTEVFTDLSLITAIANDISYKDVFAEPLRWRMTQGDMLVAISSSGQSPNVLSACEAAMALGGAYRGSSLFCGSGLQKKKIDDERNRSIFFRKIRRESERCNGLF